MSFGPRGSRKGVRIPQLPDDKSKRSHVVIDPKSEVCAINKFRRSIRGVMIIDPYELLADEWPDGRNPLADLLPDTTG